MTENLTVVLYAVAALAIVWWLTRHNVAAVASSIQAAPGTSVRIVVHNLERVSTSSDCQLQICLVDGEPQSGGPEPLRVYAGPGSRSPYGIAPVTSGEGASLSTRGVAVTNLVIPPRETIMVEWGVTRRASAFLVTMSSGPTEIFKMRVPSVDLASPPHKADAISRTGMEARPRWSAFVLSMFLAAAGGALLLRFGWEISCIPTQFHIVCADGENVLRELHEALPWWAWALPVVLFLLAVIAFHGIRRSGSTVAQGYLWDEETLHAYSEPKPPRLQIPRPATVAQSPPPPTPPPASNA